MHDSEPPRNGVENESFQMHGFIKISSTVRYFRASIPTTQTVLFWVSKSLSQNPIFLTRSIENDAGVAVVSVVAAAVDVGQEGGRAHEGHHAGAGLREDIGGM